MPLDLNSQPAIEEREILGINRAQQAPVAAPPTANAPVPGDALRLAALIHGESSGQKDNIRIMVGSTVLNRLDSGRIEEFGDSVENVIMSQNSPYFAASKNSAQFQQGASQKFPDKVSENDFKKSLQIASGLIRGSIPRHEGMFFFEGKEVSAMKRRKKKVFDFKQVKETGKVGKFHTFSY